MNSQPELTRTCPTCGTPVLDVARYCPNCGTKLEQAAAFTSDDFSDVLSDVLDVQDEGVPTETPPTFSSADAPTYPLPEAIAEPASEPTPEPTTATEWTASASGWSATPNERGTWSVDAPGTLIIKQPRNRRMMWIILAIFGFIIFCCCGGFFSLVLIAENDTAFHNEISHVAVLLTTDVSL